MIYPRYLDGPSGTLFINLYLPTESKAPTSWILHLPAFAEEMNKSRHVVNRMARNLVQKGHAVVVPDLYGTGESAGDFGDTNWECWQTDAQHLIAWMNQQGGAQITLWGLRLGALLAVDVACACPGAIRRLLLWQPVTSGRQAMTQFLRLRMAAGLMGAETESVASLRERLNAGETLEIAGYPVSPSLYSQVSSSAMGELLPAQSAALRIDLLEVAQSEKMALSPMARKLVETWGNLPHSVEGQSVRGEPFWMTQELADAPDLIEKTATLFSDIDSCSQNIVVADNHDGAEIPCIFDCDGRRLVGVLHQGSPDSRRAVLVVVGGPQYRIGSHRQFLLLARSLAKAGIPVFRFDYRGMGDSEGEYRGFEDIQDDISSAVDTLVKESPSVHEVVIWGLCDAATAASFYAPGDPRISGLVLLNPWVRSTQGEAKALLKHYYLQRLLSKGFWQKVFGGKFNVSEALDSFNHNVKNAAQDKPFNHDQDESREQNLSIRLEQHLKRFTGFILFVLSENDLTAAEFRDAVKTSKGLRKLVRQPHVQWREIAGADHTFSRKSWRDQVVELTRQWIKEW